jgi:hypothetical protein
MWGYGFVFSVTHSRIVIIFMQQTLSLLVIFQWLRYLATKWHPDRVAILKLALCISFPLFLYQSAIAPYGIGASMLLLGMLYLIRYVEEKRAAYILFSGLFFGLMLNFRSDYLYFLVMLLPAVLFFQFRQSRRIPVLHLGMWVATIFLLILPWLLYTHSKTGHYLATSTNSGHQLYMGLGQYPRNPWGIQKGDRSPQMLAAVSRQFGSDNTLTYQADTFLKTQWLQNVKEHSFGFATKMAFSLHHLYRQPFYIGDIYSKHEAIRHDARYGLAVFSNLIGRLFFLAVVGVMVIAIVRKRFLGLVLSDPLLCLSVLLIAYQVALQAVAYALFLYNTGIFFFYLLVFVYLLPVRDCEPVLVSGRQKQLIEV